MSDIIKVDSPLGYTVVCSRNQWCNHVLTGHSEMEGNEQAAANTIKKPDEVRVDKDYDNRHVYFSKTSGADYENGVFGTSVVVEISNPQIAVADVITAFASKKNGGSRDDDKLLYPKPSKD